MTDFNESAVEQAALAWLESMGWLAKLGRARSGWLAKLDRARSGWERKRLACFEHLHADPFACRMSPS